MLSLALLAAERRAGQCSVNQSLIKIVEAGVGRLVFLR